MEEGISLSDGEKQKNKDESLAWYHSDAFFNFPRPSTLSGL